MLDQGFCVQPPQTAARIPFSRQYPPQILRFVAIYARVRFSHQLFHAPRVFLIRLRRSCAGSPVAGRPDRSVRSAGNSLSKGDVHRGSTECSATRKTRRTRPRTPSSRPTSACATFDPSYRFYSWMYRILVNECLNANRGRRPEEPLDDDAAGDGTPFDDALAAERRDQIKPCAAPAHARVPHRRRAETFRRTVVRRNRRGTGDSGEDREVATLFRAPASRRAVARMERAREG